MSGYDPAVYGARCDICPIALSGNKNPVPPLELSDRSKVRLIIVGEAPGRKEQSIGSPFVGPSGRLVDRMFEDAHERRFRSYSHLTNTATCRSEYDKENDAAAVCCAPRLYYELSDFPKEVPILAFGKAAAKAILNVKSIILSRGFVWTAKEIDPVAIVAAAKKAEKTKDPVDQLKATSLEGRAKLAGRTVFPTVHPAFVLRSDTWKPILQIDVDRVARFVRGELTMADMPVTGPYVVTHGVADTQRELAKLGAIIAADIETDGINPLKAGILCVGFSDGKRTVVVAGPKVKTSHAVAWKDKNIIAVVNKFLQKWKKVVFHNGFGFDQICMKKDGYVFRPESLEDTLNAHHTFAGHLPQKLDQVVSEFANSIPWKVKFGRRGAEEKAGIAPHQMDKDELWLYNAADAVRTAVIWINMQADLAPQASVYAHDKKIAFICQQMQIDGIRMDVAHRDYLAKKMQNRAAFFKGRMRKLVKKEWFSPSKTADIRWALFTKFKAPILSTVQGAVTSTGLPSTSSGVLEAFAQQPTRAGRLSNMILQWRGVVKIKATYLDAIELGGSDRVMVSWRPWGAVTGRWASRMQSTPRPKSDKITGKKLLEGRVREVYIPADGYEFNYFDVSQAEMRFAAYLSNDQKFIEEMETSDPYLERAKALFPKATPEMWAVDARGKLTHNLGKEFRQVTKMVSLARNYLAEPEQTFAKMRADGFDVNFAQVVAAAEAINKNYRTYFRYVDRNVIECGKRGFMPSPLVGRYCWLGFYPKATEVANRPVTMGIADIMNIRLIEIVEEVKKRKLDRYCRLVLQIHDACVFETLKGDVSLEVQSIIKKTWKAPVVLPVSLVCSVEQRFVLPIDQKVAMRWADL
jgi:uracil-DNA glycosylase family 4